MRPLTESYHRALVYFHGMKIILLAGVLEVAVAMAEVGQRHSQAAKDAIAARRQLQAEAGKGIVLPSGV